MSTDIKVIEALMGLIQNRSSAENFNTLKRILTPEEKQEEGDPKPSEGDNTIKGIFKLVDGEIKYKVEEQAKKLSYFPRRHINTNIREMETLGFIGTDEFWFYIYEKAQKEKAKAAAESAEALAATESDSSTSYSIESYLSEQGDDSGALDSDDETQEEKKERKLAVSVAEEGKILQLKSSSETNIKEYTALIAALGNTDNDFKGITDMIENAIGVIRPSFIPMFLVRPSIRLVICNLKYFNNLLAEVFSDEEKGEAIVSEGFKEILISEMKRVSENNTDAKKGIDHKKIRLDAQKYITQVLDLPGKMSSTRKRVMEEIYIAIRPHLPETVLSNDNNSYLTDIVNNPESEDEGILLEKTDVSEEFKKFQDGLRSKLTKRSQQATAALGMLGGGGGSKGGSLDKAAGEGKGGGGEEETAAPAARAAAGDADPDDAAAARAAAGKLVSRALEGVTARALEGGAAQAGTESDASSTSASLGGDDIESEEAAVGEENVGAGGGAAQAGTESEDESTIASSGGSGQPIVHGSLDVLEVKDDTPDAENLEDERQEEKTKYKLLASTKSEDESTSTFSDILGQAVPVAKAVGEISQAYSSNIASYNDLIAQLSIKKGKKVFLYNRRRNKTTLGNDLKVVGVKVPAVKFLMEVYAKKKSDKKITQGLRKDLSDVLTAQITIETKLAEAKVAAPKGEVETVVRASKVVGEAVGKQSETLETTISRLKLKGVPKGEVHSPALDAAEKVVQAARAAAAAARAAAAAQHAAALVKRVVVAAQEKAGAAQEAKAAQEAQEEKAGAAQEEKEAQDAKAEAKGLLKSFARDYETPTIIRLVVGVSFLLVSVIFVILTASPEAASVATIVAIVTASLAVVAFLFAGGFAYNTRKKEESLVSQPSELVGKSNLTYEEYRALLLAVESEKIKDADNIKVIVAKAQGYLEKVKKQVNASLEGLGFPGLESKLYEGPAVKVESVGAETPPPKVQKARGGGSSRPSS